MSRILDLIVESPSTGEKLLQLLPLFMPSSGRQARAAGYGVATGNIATGSALLANDPRLRAGPHGVTLQRPALRSLRMLRRDLGVPIFRNITSSYRTPEQQAALYAQKPGLAAPPGKSYHQQGLAIDINSGWIAANPEVRQWLLAHGWRQFDPQKEPWHFSYGVVG